MTVHPFTMNLSETKIKRVIKCGKGKWGLTFSTTTNIKLLFAECLKCKQKEF